MGRRCACFWNAVCLISVIPSVCILKRSQLNVHGIRICTPYTYTAVIAYIYLIFQLLLQRWWCFLHSVVTKLLFKELCEYTCSSRICHTCSYTVMIFNVGSGFAHIVNPRNIPCPNSAKTRRQNKTIFKSIFYLFVTRPNRSPKIGSRNKKNDACSRFTNCV